jgi:hypothetical protein
MPCPTCNPMQPIPRWVYALVILTGALIFGLLAAVGS